MHRKNGSSEKMEMQPTKKNLQAAKYKLYLATQGYDLLDRKHKTYLQELALIENTTKQLKNQLISRLKVSKNLLNRTKLEIRKKRLKKITQKIVIDTSVIITFRSIMGIKVPIIEEMVEKKPPYNLYEGSISLDETFLAWQEVKILLLRLAELQTAIKYIKAGMKKAQKRASALKNITIPKYEDQIKYISNQLEERERDELARIKLALDF